MVPSLNFVSSALLSASLSYGGGDAGFILSNPPTVEIGREVTFTITIPFNGLVLFFVSLGDGPTNFPWGTMCIDYPPLFQFPLLLPGNTPIPLSAKVPCDDSLIGLVVYQQFVCFNTSDIKQDGISNQTSVQVLAPGGTSAYYADFSNIGGLQLNGSAAKVGNVVRLSSNVPSQAGTVFYTTSLPIDADTSFRTRFQFRIHGTNNGADGMTIMIQGNDPFQVGVNGSGLGYGGIGNSLAVEIDNWDSGMLDPSDNHLGLLTNGDYSMHQGFYNSPFDLEDASSHEIWVEYCGWTDELYVFLAQTPGGGKPSTPVISRTIDLYALTGGTAWIGLSAATGAVTNNHDVENWEFVVW